MVGVRGIDIGAQLQFLGHCCPPDMVEKLKSSAIHKRACDDNGQPGFGPVEADLLYAFICSHRPSVIVQIGCGVSTAVCLMAASDLAYEPEIICIEPFPTEFLLSCGRAGKIRLIREQVQEVSLDVLSSLTAGSLFFVDSTHTLGPAGEVTRVILEMLPRIPKGCIAHFHDITFPYDYGRNVLTTELFFPHESALLHAFLTGNSNFSVLLSMSMLHYEAAQRVRNKLPNYVPATDDFGMSVDDNHFPSSTYIVAD